MEAIEKARTRKPWRRECGHDHTVPPYFCHPSRSIPLRFVSGHDFSHADKPFIFVIPRRLQPAGDLLFRFFQQPLQFAGRAFLAFGLLLALTGFAFAQNITGTVTNATTGKPAAGDEVTLLSLSQGMQEVGSRQDRCAGQVQPGRSGRPGRTAYGARHAWWSELLSPRRPADAGRDHCRGHGLRHGQESLTGCRRPLRWTVTRADGDQLQVISLFAVRNESRPPRTLDSDKTFEFVLPAGAALDAGMARSPKGQPLNMSPTETSQKGHYAFSFPLRPGETQFQVSYHMPYSGEASFSPKPLADVQHFVVMTAKGMTFTPKNVAALPVDARRFRSRHHGGDQREARRGPHL